MRASPYASDFCAPDCQSVRCDGICTVQGRDALCLRGCRLQADGTSSDCGDGLACVRTSAEWDDGVCYPVRRCRGSTDCSAGEVCLAELVGLTPADPRSNGYYCVPAPDMDGECPSRSRPVALESGTELCVATCDPPDTRCPPGFGCLLQAAVLSDVEVLCYPGIYGVPCDDDTNCLLGRCLDTGASGRQCTLGCDEAARLAGGCGGLSSLATHVSALTFECDPAAAGGGGLCVIRSGIGFVCTTPESDAYVCADGLECRTFSSAFDQVRLCTKGCRTDRECNAPGAYVNYCQPFLEESVCLPRFAVGARCSDPRQCLSDRCERGVCVD
ncbi:MAG: hypothetical protein KF901_07165 [Myxococcales bacterium]|nr:hypothetical protein [Myxococcales bacterium]